MTRIQKYSNIQLSRFLGGDMKAIRFIVMLLMVIGSLNWGLVGFFGYNLIGDIHILYATTT